MPDGPTLGTAGGPLVRRRLSTCTASTTVLWPVVEVDEDGVAGWGSVDPADSIWEGVYNDFAGVGRALGCDGTPYTLR